MTMVGYSFIKSLLPLAILSTAPLAYLSAQTNIREPDFAEDFEELGFLEMGESEERFLEGPFPDSLVVRSFWKDATYRGRFTELGADNFSGSNALRLDLKHSYKCYVDLYTRHTFSSSKFLKIQIALRAPRTGRFDLLVCKEDSPGQPVWQRKRIHIPAEWQQQEFIIPPQTSLPDGTPLVVLIRFSQPDIYDLDALRIFTLTGADLNEPIPHTKGNLLGNSYFPDGLPSGWSVNRAGYPNLIATSPSVAGPSGKPALQFLADRRLDLRSRPFQAFGGETYTVRFHAKGSKDQQSIRVGLDSGAKQNSAVVELTDQWDLYEIEIEMPYPLNGFQFLRIRADEPVFFDELQMARDVAELFVESVELTVKADTHYGLVVGETPYQVRITLVGQTGSEGELEANLVDTFGNRISLPPISYTIDEDGLFAHVLQLPAALHPSIYGSHRLEVRRKATNGEEPTGWTELLLHRVRSPAMLHQDAPQSPFGLHLSGASAQQLQVAKQLGFNWIRLHDGANFTKWYNLEKVKSQGLVYEIMRERVRKVRQHHLLILGMLDTTPPWYSRNPKKKNTRYFWDATWVPDDQNAWRNYVKTTVHEFREEIQHWEIWNEPYVGRFFQLEPQGKRAQHGSPDDYHSLVVDAYGAAKQGNPDTTILIATKAGKWANQAAELATTDHADGSTFHLYTPKHCGHAGDIVAREVESIRRSFADTRLAKAPVWQTEGGPGRALPNAYEYTPTSGKNDGLDLADYVIRFYVSHLAAGVDKLFIYSLHAIGSWTPSWGLIGHDDTLQPWTTAASNLALNLENKKWQRRISLQSGGAVHFFHGQEDAVAILLPLVGHSLELPYLPPNSEYQDMFGNAWRDRSTETNYPVYVRLSTDDANTLWQPLAPEGSDSSREE